MQVNRPKEYRPELADASKPQSKEEQMRQQLGLGPDDVGPGDEEDEAPPAPARRGGGGGAAGGAEKRVAELEAKNAELEKKLASEGTRRDEQVETIKKLANSRMARPPAGTTGNAAQNHPFFHSQQILPVIAKAQFVHKGQAHPAEQFEILLEFKQFGQLLQLVIQRFPDDSWHGLQGETGVMGDKLISDQSASHDVIKCE